MTKHGGTLDAKVMWNFSRLGDIRVPRALPGGRSAGHGTRVLTGYNWKPPGNK